MKNKFQRLSKEEKQKAINDYYKTTSGEENKKRFKRILIYGIICIVYGTYVIIEQIINNVSNFNYAFGATLLIAGLFFLIARHRVIVQKVNNYLIKKKK